MVESKDQGIKRTFNLPDGVSVTLENGLLSLQGPKGKVTKDFFSPVFDIKAEGNVITLAIPTAKRKFLRVFNTMCAHMKNMIKGVTEGYTYEVKICSGHFPMTVKKEGNTVNISNFLGERIPRVSKILDDVELDIKGDMITITSADIERAGQTAANLEHATVIKKRDRRVFQDGCYIISKPKQSKQ